MFERDRVFFDYIDGLYLCDYGFKPVIVYHAENVNDEVFGFLRTPELDKMLEDRKVFETSTIKDAKAEGQVEAATCALDIGKGEAVRCCTTDCFMPYRIAYAAMSIEDRKQYLSMDEIDQRRLVADMYGISELQLEGLDNE